METKQITDEIVEGDLVFDGHIVIVGNATILGSIKCRSLEVGGWLKVNESLEVGGSLEVNGWLKIGGSLKIGGWLEVGEYVNLSFVILDFEKIRTKIIRFTPTLYHERNFWLAVLPTDLCELRDAISSGKCWRELLPLARKHRDVLLAGEYIPAVRQAIELMSRTVH